MKYRQMHSHMRRVSRGQTLIADLSRLRIVPVSYHCIRLDYSLRHMYPSLLLTHPVTA